MIGYICSAVTELVVTFADDADIVNLHNWSQGSFSGMTWDNVKVMAVVVTVTLTAVFLLSKPLSAYQLGEEYGSKYSLSANMSCDPVQYFVCLHCSFCRADIIRWNCNTPPGEKVTWDNKTAFDDTCLFFRRKCILSVLRFTGKDDSCTNRTEYQYSNGYFRSSGCFMGNGGA